MQSVTIKVNKKIIEIIEEMIKLGIARSRNHAFNIVIEAGIPKVMELIKHKKKVNELVEKFLQEGLPYEKLPTTKDVEEVRSR